MFGVRHPVTNRRFDRCTALSDRLSGWRDPIGANCGRCNERFGIVNNERFERVDRTLDNRLFALDKVENIDTVTGFVKSRTCKPVSASFDKLQLVKSGALFSPSWAFRNQFYLIDEVLLDPIGVAIPGDVPQPVVNMNWPWQTIQTEPVPVPQLKREDVWSSTDFKDHT